MDLCTGGLAWPMLREIGKGRKGWCRRMEIVKEIERSRSVKPWSWINTGDDSLLSSRPCSAALPVPVLWGVSPLTSAKI